MISRLTLLLALLFAFYPSHAQRFQVRWGDHARLKYDFSDAVPLSGGKMMVLKFRSDSKLKFGPANTVYTPILVLVDKNLETIREAELPIKEEDHSYKGFEKYGDHIYYFYESYDKGAKTTSVHAIKIDEENLSVATKLSLGTFASSKRSDQAESSYKLSLDSSKIVLYVEPPEKKKSNKSFFFHVFNTDLTTIWKKEIELPIESKFISIHDYDVTNRGDVILALKHYDKAVTRESVREDGDKIPSYTYKLFIYNGAQPTPSEIVLDLKNRYVQGTKLTYNYNNQITVAGLYKQKYNGRINGVFYLTLDPETFKMSNPVMSDFSQDILDLVKKDGYGSPNEKDPGLSNRFRIRHVMNRMNGSVDLIAEYYLLTVTYSSSTTGGASRPIYTYHYGDIINTNINGDGKAVFSRIPKRQQLVNMDAYTGFFPIVQQDRLVLLYNDSHANSEKDLTKKPDLVRNFKRSVLVAATLDSKGNISRQTVYDHRDEDYITSPRSTSKIGENQYLLSAYILKVLKRRTRYGYMEVK